MAKGIETQDTSNILIYIWTLCELFGIDCGALVLMALGPCTVCRLQSRPNKIIQHVCSIYKLYKYMIIYDKIYSTIISYESLSPFQSDITHWHCHYVGSQPVSSWRGAFGISHVDRSPQHVAERWGSCGHLSVPTLEQLSPRPPSAQWFTPRIFP